MHKIPRLDLVLYVFLGMILLLYILGFALAYVSSQSLIRDQFKSGTLEVSCLNCSGGENVTVQFSGVYSINFAAVVPISGNGTQIYTLDRGASTHWTVSWGVQKNTIQGSLEVKLTLSNGTTTYDRSTESPYGSIVGYWNYSQTL